MKNLSSLFKFSLATLSLVVLAQSASAAVSMSAQNCLFGMVAGDWSKMTDAHGQALFQAGEKINLFSAEREQAVGDLEHRMIQLAVGANHGLKESMQIFTDLPDRSNAGSIDFFTLRGSDRKFAEVYFYPGENQVGVIVEISPNGDLAVLADIQDGDLYNCQATL